MSNSIAVLPAFEAFKDTTQQVIVSGLDAALPHRQLGTEAVYGDGTRDKETSELRAWMWVGKEMQDEHLWIATMVDEEGEMRIRGVMNWVQAQVSEEGVFQPSQISMLVVEPSFHGRGIATALLNYAQETTLDTYTHSLPNETKSDARVIMIASCLAESVPAKHIFEKKGFVAVDGEVQEMLKEKVLMMEWKAPDMLPSVADDL